MRLRNKIVIVTGAASGIGKATALMFAREGASVVAVDISADGVKEIHEFINKHEGSSIYIQADISRDEDVARVVEQTIKTYGRIDILHNNAGIFEFGTVVDYPETAWDRMMAVNLKSMFLFSKHVIPYMKDAGGGSIVNTASIGGMVGVENATAYAASKGAVIQLTRSMAVDYGKYQIRVNCVCPGSIETPMLKGIWKYESQGQTIEEMRDQYIQGRPLRRIGTPEDVAYAVLYLASDESRFVTGTTLVVDGGIEAM